MTAIFPPILLLLLVIQVAPIIGIIVGGLLAIAAFFNFKRISKNKEV